MRRFWIVLVLSSLAYAPVSASELEINQNATANYAFVAVNEPASSVVRIDQKGRTNAISAAQLSPDLNQIQTSQSGWTNTVTVYQEGFIDVSRVVQSAPDGSPHNGDLPAGYTVAETDQGFLATFTSGEISIATLTSPDMTYVSRFGRRH